MARASDTHTLGCGGPAVGTCIVAGGLVANVHVVVGAKAGSKGRGQLLVHWQLRRPWLSACVTVAAGSCHGHTAVEGDDGGWAQSMQVHWLPVSTVQAYDGKTRPHLGPPAAAGALTSGVLFHVSLSAPHVCA